MIIEPIAYIKTDFPEKFGVPRQSGRASEALGRIFFTEKYSSREAIRGIEEFSYLWLIFDFSLSHSSSFSPTVRPPRLGGNKRVGVFASRSPFRPNSLGLSCVKLERIEESEKGAVLVVSGVDMTDGTPIYDIKPYIPYADCKTDAKGSFAEENKAHRLAVVFPDKLLDIMPQEKSNALIQCLADDPRPSYQDDAERVYGMKFSSFNVNFTVKGETLTVTDVRKDGD